MPWPLKLATPLKSMAFHREFAMAPGLLEGVEPVNSLILFGHFLQDDWQIGKQGYFNGDEHDEINIVEIKCD
jgi:hypothetical protein